MTEEMDTYDAVIKIIERDRDCNTCARPKNGTQACPMPTMDVNTCLTNSSRPFWKPKPNHMSRPTTNQQAKNEPGKKYDSGKPRYDLLPPDVLAEVVKIITDGAEKYGERNWEAGMSWSRPFAAAMRHLWAFWDRQNIDPESGSPHLAHAIVNLMFLLAYQGRGVGTDDRRRHE